VLVPQLLRHEAMTLLGDSPALILVREVVTDDVWQVVKRRLDEVLAGDEGRRLPQRLGDDERLVAHPEDQPLARQLSGLPGEVEEDAGSVQKNRSGHPPIALVAPAPLLDHVDPPPAQETKRTLSPRDIERAEEKDVDVPLEREVTPQPGPEAERDLVRRFALLGEEVLSLRRRHAEQVGKPLQVQAAEPPDVRVRVGRARVAQNDVRDLAEVGARPRETGDRRRRERLRVPDGDKRATLGGRLLELAAQLREPVRVPQDEERRRLGELGVSVHAEGHAGAGLLERLGELGSEAASDRERDRELSLRGILGQMLQILAVFQVLVAIALTVLVLMHSGRDTGFGGLGFTPMSHGGQHVVERNLTRLTVVVAIIFTVNTVALFYLL
jgi:preprotein translocase subunit SecG